MFMRIPFNRMRVTVAIFAPYRAANDKTNKFVFCEHVSRPHGDLLPPAGEEQHRIAPIPAMGMCLTFPMPFLKLLPDLKNRNDFFSHKYNNQVTISRHVTLMQRHYSEDGALALPSRAHLSIIVGTFIYRFTGLRETKPKLQKFLH